MAKKIEQICNSEIFMMTEEIFTRGIETDTFEMNAFVHKCKLTNKRVSIAVFSDENEYYYILFDNDATTKLSYSEPFETLALAKDYAIDEADNKY